MNIEDFDFNTGKRISIEIGTRLQIRIDGVDINYTSTLIGMETGKYLIIDAPVNMLTLARHKLFQGSKILVRYLHKGSVFGFKSELIEDIYTPLKLLFLEYPEIIEVHNLRSGQRIDCVLPVRIKINDEERNGIISDINKEGCRCVTKKTEEDKELSSVQIDEQVTLMCQFPRVEGERTIIGKVRNIRRDKKQMILGIIFNGIGPEIEEIIGQYILAIKE
jgi:hypothetical protein